MGDAPADLVAHVILDRGETSSWFDGTDPRHHVISGGMDPPPRAFVVYLARFVPAFQPYLAAIRTAVARAGLVGLGAESAAFHFAFDDGTRVCFTARAWGDLMAAVRGRGESYTKFAWERGMVP